MDPRARGEYARVLNHCRPCSWTGCSYNLSVDVNRDTGHLKVVIDPDDLDTAPETCSLDVADRAAAGEEVTCDAVGQMLGGLSRERVRQIEASGLRKLQRKPGKVYAKLRSYREEP